MWRRSNCFFFSVRCWFRWRKKGAYWWVRRSRHIAGWHWGVYYKGRLIHYEPKEPKKEWYLAALHKVWYEGNIKRTD